MAKATTRRRALWRGIGGLTVLAVGGLVWRAWDNGVFSVGRGPAYAPWHDWREDAVSGALAVVHAGILAANAHNSQPWRFGLGESRIALHADHARNLGSFDPYRRELHLSLGCALENMVHAARAQGLDAIVEPAAGRLALAVPPPDAAPVAVIGLAPGAPAEKTALYRAIAARHTHRGAYLADRPVSRDLMDEMRGRAGDSVSVRLFLLAAGAEKARLGALIVSATEAIIADRAMSADSARWFRFDWDSVERHRDGVTLDAVGLPALVNAAAKILPAPAPERADAQWLETTRDVHVATAPLLGLIAVRDLYDRATTLAAGRLWQRLHLWATARGLVAQPLNQPAEMADRERDLNAPPRTAQALAEVTGDPDWKPTFVFRLGYADRPARLSPRRDLASVLDRG